jgi:hypothetical protein
MMNTAFTWQATRSNMKLAASMLTELNSEDQEMSQAKMSCPGEAGVAVEERNNASTIKTTANIDELIQAYLSAYKHNAWCLLNLDDSSGVFSKPTSKHPTVRDAAPAKQKQGRNDKHSQDRKRRWFDEDGWLRAPDPSVELRWVHAANAEST